MRCGDLVRFGTMIGVEPWLSIGDGAVVSSGVVLTGNVPSEGIVKKHTDYSIKTEGESDEE